MLGLLKVLAGVRVETGSLNTPSGEQYNGFKITVGGITDPATVQRTYDDIEMALGKNKVPFKTHETVGPNGRFRSYSVESVET